MARRKKNEALNIALPEAEPMIQPITETIEKNFMPYAMSVIISRAIPDIDGFKPSHRKLLYTMYKMGLLTGGSSSSGLTKCANVVGQTMKLNPHGDASIYDTLVRLTKDNETLLHPFIFSKGSFGKQYSSEMPAAAPRYTECKLDPFAAEIFGGINKDAVEMIDNYDGTLKEPVLLPTSFPNILVAPNTGVAVSMTTNICSFNLGEICDATIQILRNPDTTVDAILDIMPAPDFPGGAFIIYNRDKMREIYETGRGSVRMRAKCSYDRDNNMIEILEIPYSTKIELILKKFVEMVKEGKLKEVSDFRDEIDISGFKLTVDLKRGTDYEKLLAKLYKATPLEDSFSCNFNVLINGSPRLMGVIEILKEWIKFRMGCVRRELTYDLGKNKEKLHLLLGLGKILLDIDKAIRIVRETKLEKDVVPNLMEGFGIDEIQAEYIAEIKLRNLNREYIVNRIQEIEDLQKTIAELEAIISSDRAIKNVIAKQLREVKQKFGKPRKTQLIYDDMLPEVEEEEIDDSFSGKIFLTKEGYFKKISHTSLKGNDEHKHKDGDSVMLSDEASNRDELIFFSNKGQAYKAHVVDFGTCKASELGDYIPSKLGFDDGEKVLTMIRVSEYKEGENMIFIFQNGKGVRVPITAYETKTNRRKLTGAYSDASPIVAAFRENEPMDVMLISNVGKAIIINSSLIPVKTTRSAQGVTLYTLKKKQQLDSAIIDFASKWQNTKKYKKTKIPATGVQLEELDVESQQISML